MHNYIIVCVSDCNAAPHLIMEDNLMREALRNTCSITVECWGFVNLNIWLILLKENVDVQCWFTLLITFPDKLQVLV